MDEPSIYLIQKHAAVLDMIRPICAAFGIIDYDYEIDEKENERLRINDTRIGCTSNSMSAIKEELVGYIFVKFYCKNRWWHFKPQTVKAIKRYWI